MTYTENLHLSLQGRKPEKVSLDALNTNFETLDETIGEHNSNTDIHVTNEEKAAWNGKADAADMLTIHTALAALTARVEALESVQTEV